MTKKKDQTKLNGVPDIRRFFHKNETPIYFISATNFNMRGADEWIKGFKYICYIECFDGLHPNVFSPKQEIPHDEFKDIEDINSYLLQHPEALADIVYSMQGQVGVMILNRWNFPKQMIEVVDKCHDFRHDHDGDARLVDLVQVALLQGSHVPGKYRPNELSAIPAFANLGMDSEVNVIDIEENKELIENTKQSLMI